MSAIGKTPPAAIPPLLTQREMMIVFLMSAGHTASEIAKLLELRPRTVENRKRSIYEKLGVGNQSHAVAKAIWLGLLQPGPPPTLAAARDRFRNSTLARSDAQCSPYYSARTARAGTR